MNGINKLIAKAIDTIKNLKSMISEILTGKNDLNKRQVFALVTKFGIPPAVFL